MGTWRMGVPIRTTSVVRRGRGIRPIDLSQLRLVEWPLETISTLYIFSLVFVWRGVYRRFQMKLRTFLRTTETRSLIL